MRKANLKHICLATIFCFAGCNSPTSSIEHRSDVVDSKTNQNNENTAVENKAVSILNLVTRAQIRDAGISSVYQVITSDPDFHNKAANDRSGIYYTYFFDKNGRRIGELSGYNNTVVNYIYNGNDQVIGTYWTDNEPGPAAEFIHDYEIPKYQDWETTTANHADLFAVHSACYSVSALYEIGKLQTNGGGLPETAELNFTRLLPEFRMAPESRRKLYVSFAYSTFDIEKK